MISKRLEQTQLEVPTDSSAAKWIEPELTGDLGSVTSVVPDRFESYVRVFHPATTREGKLIRWSDVAAALGQEMHALVQWHVLVGTSDPDDLADSQWSGGAPERGDLCPEILEPLYTLLERYTSRAEHCFFGVWTGWTVIALRANPQGTSVRGKEELPRIRSGDDIPGPRFGLPSLAGRDYALLSGPLGAATEIAESDESGGLAPTSPTLVWPADRSWFLASEIDFDSTLVGGSSDLIGAIVDADDIEAWSIGPRDSLAVDVDGN
jgi:hypothetical protein